MNTLNIAATDDTPLVNFNETDSSLKISGRSMPEDAISFYTPIIQWLEECQTTGFGLSQIDFHFEFLSTSSTKQIMKVFQTVNKINVTKEINQNVTIQTVTQWVTKSGSGAESTKFLC